MNTLFRLVILLLLSGSALAADRITLTVTVTNTPVNGNTFVLNADTRTWTNTVVTAATQILISTNGTGANATNLFNQAAQYLFSGPVIPGMPATNKVSFVGQVGEAMSASITGTWAELAYTTQTVSVATTVRVPITAEPTASIRTNIVSLLVSNVFNLGLSTEKILPGATVMDNFVDTSEAQTVAGIKTFTAANVYSNSTQRFTLGTISNVTARMFAFDYATNNIGIIFSNTTILTTDGLGRPSLYSSLGAPNHNLGSAVAYVPNGENLLNAASGDYRYGQLATANSWSGNNTFSVITNSTIKNSTITNSTYYGNAGLLTNGTYFAPTLTNATHKGSAFQSYYAADTTTLQLGLDAVASGASSVAAGNLATASGANSIAIGAGATATHANAVAISGSAATVADFEIRLGGTSHNVAAPGKVYVGNSLVIGHANSPALPAGLAKGLYWTNGTAASADPVNGIVMWVDTGALQYRSSAANEGSGTTHFVHNRQIETIGSGADYTLTTSYATIDLGGTDPDTTLPTAGTYHVIATIGLIAGGTANDVYQFKLRNSSDGADISSTETTVSNAAASTTQSVVIHKIVTLTGSKVLQIHAKNTTAARGSIKAVETRLLAIRLY